MMNVRPATTQDAEAIASIFNTYLGRGTMVLDPRSAKDYLTLMTTEKTEFLVGVDEQGVVIGFAYVKPYSYRKGYSLAGEVSIYLSEDIIGAGLGTKLYDELIPVTDTLGYRHLTAKIWANNTTSILFHKLYGFRMVGTQVGIGWVNNKRVDTVIMERVWYHD